MGPDHDPPARDVSSGPRDAHARCRRHLCRLRCDVARQLTTSLKPRLVAHPFPGNASTRAARITTAGKIAIVGIKARLSTIAYSRSTNGVGTNSLALLRWRGEGAHAPDPSKRRC